MRILRLTDWSSRVVCRLLGIHGDPDWAADAVSPEDEMGSGDTARH